MEQSSDMLNSILKWNHSNKVRKLTNKNKVNAMQMCLQSKVRILKLFTKYFCEVCKSSKKFSYISSPQNSIISKNDAFDKEDRRRGTWTRKITRWTHWWGVFIHRNVISETRDISRFKGKMLEEERKVDQWLNDSFNFTLTTFGVSSSSILSCWKRIKPFSTIYETKFLQRPKNVL